VPGNTAGHNNSNLTPLAASVANGGWELLLGIVPIVVFIYFPINSPCHPSLSPLEEENNQESLQILGEVLDFISPSGGN
jgi:hypothetical protein